MPDFTEDELVAMLAAKRAEPRGANPHARVHHDTPHRKAVRFTKEGVHKISGQVLPINQVAKDGVLASDKADAEGRHTWTIPAEAVVYVHDAVAVALVDSGHADVVEAPDEHEPEVPVAPVPAPLGAAPAAPE